MCYQLHAVCRQITAMTRARGVMTLVSNLMCFVRRVLGLPGTIAQKTLHLPDGTVIRWGRVHVGEPIPPARPRRLTEVSRHQRFKAPGAATKKPEI